MHALTMHTLRSPRAPAGALRLTTEFGLLEVEPCEVVVVPRGVRFAVELLDGQVRLRRAARGGRGRRRVALSWARVTTPVCRSQSVPT